MNIEFNGKVYFTEEELKCKGSGKLILAPGFAEALLAIRIAWGRPLHPTSVCRSREYNRKIGSTDGSWHVCDDNRGGARAIDIRMINAEDRKAFVELALAMGWSVGINKTFVHIDRRVDAGEKQLMFTY